MPTRLDERHSPFREGAWDVPFGPSADRVGTVVRADALRKLRSMGDGFLGGGLRGFAPPETHRDQPLVWIGAGGSVLGARVVSDVLCPGVELRAIDNSDPACLARAFRGVDPAECRYVLCSKSGATLETCAVAAVVDGLLPGGFAAHRDRTHVVVGPGASPLRAFAESAELPIVCLPGDVGGRYAVFTAAGLLPMLLRGGDAEPLLAGARDALEAAEDDGAESPGVRLGATLALAHRLRGMGTHVLMPYSSELTSFGDWFVQLWAESLGKRLGRDGAVVESGPTPIAAVGSADQHSVLQLLAEGPRDKLTVFVSVRTPARDFVVPASPLVPPTVWRTSLAELLAFQCRATETSLAAAGRPSLRLELDDLGARSLGDLLATCIVATVVAAEIYDVDAFGQPGVEAGKRNVLDRLEAGRSRGIARIDAS